MALKLEFRKDLTKKSVIILASGREKRPMQLAKDGKMPCFFCKGSEKLTPPATCEIPIASWQVRCFENAFPMLSPLLKFDSKKPLPQPAYGEHEVIAEYPNDTKLFQDFPKQNLKFIWQAYCLRFKSLSMKKGIKHVHLFKNHGKSAGASIAHEHSQIISLPFTPPLLESEFNHFNLHKKKNGKCYYCNLLKVESQNILFKTKDFIAIAPSFARFSHEIWLIPKKHLKSMLELNESQGVELLESLQKCIKKLSQVTADYNLAYHNSLKQDFHFHVEFYPRTAIWAGVEFGAGIPVRTQSETDTKQLFK